MSELVTVTLKMTTELRDRLKARAAAEQTSVSALLIDGVSEVEWLRGALAQVTTDRDQWISRAAALAPLAELQATVAEMEITIDLLTVDRNQWRDRAKAIVSAGTAKEPSKRGSEPMGRQPHHPAGPVQASAVPEVAGTVPWCGLKGQKTGR
jgi:hypothetical protein